jgi:argininosuccinate lyase
MKSGKATRKANTKAKASEMAMAQVWGHRFQEPLDGQVAGFLASIGFDRELAWADIAGSIAHAELLGKTGVIPAKDAAVLVAGLRKVWARLSSGQAPLDVTHEDIHMNVEALLREEVGEVAGLLHAGRSRNDQVALDLRLYMREHIALTVAGLVSLQEALLGLASGKPGHSHSSPPLGDGREIVLQGHTHMQPAQPVLLAHFALAHVERFQRDIERLADAFKRVNISPLGAGALAGTGLDIDPEITAKILGFEGVFKNSLDAVSDRDFVYETLSGLALVSVHLSSLCEELIIWCSGEVGWATMGDAVSTGSSMMPQKKNPDVLELVRGKTGRILGHVTAIGTMLKGLPLAYNKDLQEDKEATFDAFATVEACLGAMVPALEQMHLHPEKMADAISSGSYATDLCEFLVKKGVPFRDAHGTVGTVVLWCEKNGKQIDDLDSDDLKSFHPAFEGLTKSLLTAGGSVKAKKSHGSTGPSQVTKAFAKAIEQLKANHAMAAALMAPTTMARALL